MIRYVLRTKDRQGEYLKPEYDGKTPNSETGWNHFIHWNKAKVESYARVNNIKGEIVRITI